MGNEPVLLISFSLSVKMLSLPVIMTALMIVQQGNFLTTLFGRQQGRRPDSKWSNNVQPENLRNSLPELSFLGSRHMHCDTFYANWDYNPPLPLKRQIAPEDYNRHLDRKCRSVSSP